MMDIPRGKVIVVDRGERKLRAGQGMLKGMGVIWRHWTASFRKLENFSETAGTFTIEYPEEKRPLPETYRNMPILLYDDENGHELCTSCFQCQRICPPQVIHMTQAKDPTTGKAVPAVAEFIIEYDACMSCGFCAEVCPFDAIKMDHEFELSTAEHPKLTTHKTELLRPISYYTKIAPTLWNEVKDGAYKKLQGNIKRRSGVIGIAPQMVERLKASGKLTAAPAAAAPAPAPAKPAPAKPAPAKPAAPAAAADAKPVSAEDKAAKLAAIRAANAAKSGGAAPPAAPAAPAAGDDKAAKLAAIRAANAAKKTADGGDAAPAPAAQAPAAPAAGDDKAAKLAAIRAANAAKKTAEGGDAAPAPAAQPVAPSAPSAGTGPSDEKAARLAAIRAANAAKQAGEQNAQPAAAPQSAAPPQPVTAQPAKHDKPSNGNETAPASPPASQNVSDEKAARLAAIRAANAAKKEQGSEDKG